MESFLVDGHNYRSNRDRERSSSNLILAYSETKNVLAMVKFKLGRQQKTSTF